MVCHQTSVGSLPSSRLAGVTSPGAMYGSRSTSALSKWYFAGFLTYTRIVSCFVGQRYLARAP